MRPLGGPEPVCHSIETGVKRFDTEAEAAANLDHSGIVPVFEVGQHDGQCYFSMGFVEGQSLSYRRAEGPFPPREAAKLMVKVAVAIEQRKLVGGDMGCIYSRRIVPIQRGTLLR